MAKTVKEYSEQVQELLKASNGTLPGIKLAKDVNMRMNVSYLNGNPALIFSETTEDYSPTKIAYCIELGDIQTVRALQIWLEDAMGLFTHNMLQKTDVGDIVNS